MPIRAVLDDGLADLVAPFEIHRAWREPTASGATTPSTRNSSSDDGGGAGNFEPLSGSWSNDDVRSDRGCSLLGLLVGQSLGLGLRLRLGLSLSLGLGLSLSLSLSLGLCLLLDLHAVDDGSILTPNQLVRDELLLEPLLRLSRWLLDLLLDELSALQGKPGSLLLRLKVRSGHDDLLQLDWLLDAGRDVCLLGLLEDLPGRTAGHRDGNLVDYLLRSDDVFRLLLLLTTIRFQLYDLVLNLLE